MKTRAFTLIELLVVIAIIGLLSSVVLASLNGARARAQYTSIASELQETQKALYLLSTDRGCWPLEGSTACGGVSNSNPTINSLIANSSFGLGKYISTAPDWPFSSDSWHYDNDGDRKATSCTSPDNRGVNIFVDGVTEEQYAALEKILDGDDPDTAAAKSCGKLFYSPGASAGAGEIMFSISSEQ